MRIFEYYVHRKILLLLPSKPNKLNLGTKRKEGEKPYTIKRGVAVELGISPHIFEESRQYRTVVLQKPVSSRCRPPILH